MFSADTTSRALYAVCFLAVLIAAGCGGSSQSARSPSGSWDAEPDRPIRTPAAGEEVDWVEETLGEMSLAEKAAQLIFVRSYGYYLNDESDHIQRLFSLVREKKIGGLCIFQSDIHTGAILLNRLQAESDVPLLVASDFEWGAGMRFRRSSRYPEAMALGATRYYLNIRNVPVFKLR